MIVVLEGLSGSGKTSQALALRSWFSCTLSVHSVGEFGESGAGRIIEAAYRREKARFVDLSADGFDTDGTQRLLLCDALTKARQAQQSDADLTIIDRLFDSWLAYGLATTGRSYFTDAKLWTMFSRLRSWMSANSIVTVYLDIAVQKAVQRLRDRDGFGAARPDVERLYRIRQNYLSVYSEYQALIVNAESETAVTTQRIVRLIDSRRRVSRE